MKCPGSTHEPYRTPTEHPGAPWSVHSPLESVQNVHDPQEQMEFLPYSQATVRKPTVVLVSHPPSWVVNRKPGQALLQDTGSTCIPEELSTRHRRLSLSQSPST